MLPELTGEGELPPGVHVADWQEFQARFCSSSLRRVWLSGRLQALLALAATNGKLRRVFIWGSFVTAKPAPKDLDILLIMDDDFEVDELAAPAQAVFDSVRARADVPIGCFLGSVFHRTRIARSLVGHVSDFQELS